MTQSETLKIAAVIVAFNRKDMLAQCLKGLLAQSRPVSHVFVVNNASTDGTKEFLDAAYGDNPLFTLCHLPTNTGGAGGFNKGMELASTEGFDWYWMMDDDVVPQPDCLATLMTFTDTSKCLHPRKRYLDGTDFAWFGKFNPASGRIHFKSEAGIWTEPAVEVNFGCFEGMLVADEIVKKIGLPDKKYFISYDDRIYGYLASKHTKVLYVRDAFMSKLIKKDPNTFSAFSFFYRVRNLFMLRQDLKNEASFSTLAWLKYSVLFIGHNVVQGMKQKNGGLNAIKTAWKGIVAGVALK